MISLFFIILISFLPIVFWAYIFSSLKEEKLNKQRFFVGILAWIISVVPILYFEQIINFLKFNFVNFFEKLNYISSFSTTFNFFYSVLFFIIFIIFISYLIWLLFSKKNIFTIFLKSFFLVVLFIFFISFSFYFIDLFAIKFDFLNKTFSKWISFWNTIFNTIKLIIFYYVLIAFIEEISKHFNFIWVSAFSIKKVSDWVLYAIFIALWFSFVENILYLYNLYKISGLGFVLVKTYFFRSIFSIILHIISSVVLAYFFSKYFLLKNKFSYLKYFLYWFWISIFLHFFFDFSLTMWFSFVIFLYFVFSYLYISYIFYIKN